MWILIAIFYTQNAGTPPITSVPNFGNYAACQAAGQAFNNMAKYGEVKFICVSRDTGATTP